MNTLQSFQGLFGPERCEGSGAQEECRKIHVLVGSATPPVNKTGLGAVKTSKRLALAASDPRKMCRDIMPSLDWVAITADTELDNTKIGEANNDGN